MSEISAGNSSSSKSLMFMTLALFAGFGVMLGGGLFIAKRLAETMGLAAATGSKDTVRTPIGAFRMEKEDQVGPGLPVYPRSSLEVPSDVATGKALSDSKNGVTVVPVVEIPAECVRSAAESRSSRWPAPPLQMPPGTRFTPRTNPPGSWRFAQCGAFR